LGRRLIEDAHEHEPIVAGDDLDALPFVPRQNSEGRALRA
jgi:hypothetical protein